ncbi:unnamed protein product [Bursaphelenchus okinawaensis]|uniref:Uncharacterized protein n=1 Tax=Bursaphelenchus okinawaensis TaxID=465554 RepID=A0A811KAS5_9BILA|nr:unnamed protein product [Bursaphelenchus okinawaensis]CAG9096707.1 unnamed protein product [Bursaphelenchus okinawaensis]
MSFKEGSLWRMSQELVDKEELARRMGVGLNFKLTPDGDFRPTTPAEKAEILANLGKENKEEVKPKPEPAHQIKTEPWVKKEHGGVDYRGHNNIKREMKTECLIKQEPGCSNYRGGHHHRSSYQAEKSGRAEAHDRNLNRKRPINSVEPEVPRKVIKVEPGLEEAGPSCRLNNQPVDKPGNSSRPANTRPSNNEKRAAKTSQPTKPNHPTKKSQPTKPNRPTKPSQPTKQRPPAKIGPTFEELMAIAAKKQSESFKLPTRAAPKTAPFTVKQEIFNEDEWHRMREEKKERKRAMMIVKQELVEEPVAEPPMMRRIKEEPVEEEVPSPLMIMRKIKEETVDPFLAEMELQIGAYEQNRGLLS